MTTPLDATSLAYLTSLGDTTSDEDTVANNAETSLSAALMSGQQVDPQAVLYLMDYYKNSPSTFASWLTDPSQGANGQSKMLIYCDNGGLPTAALAPLLCSTLYNSTVNNAANNCMQTLNNLAAANYPSPPPASMITFIASLPPDSDGKPFSNSTWGSPFYHAQLAAIGYMNTFLAAGKALDPTVLAAYAQLDPAGSTTTFDNDIQAYMGANGSVDPALMSAYFAANPNNPGGNSSTSHSSSFANLDPSFQSPPPVISGWAWMALSSMTRAITAGKPIDPTMLSNLDGASPVAGAYVRWFALKQQAANGTPLQSDYLSELESANPAAAAQVCTTALNQEIAANQAPNTTYLNFVAQMNPQGAATICESALNASIAANQPLDPNLLQIVANYSQQAASGICQSALMAEVAAGKGLSPDGLTYLQTNDPQAAVTVCTAALQAQLKAGQDLNPAWLQIVANADPTTATNLCVQDFQASLFTTNQLVPASDTGVSATDGITNDATPTVKVSLTSMGVQAPKVGDVVTLYSDGAAVGTATLTSADIGNGYVDIAPASALADGAHVLTTGFTSGAYTSPISLQLKVTVHTAAPTPTSIETYLASPNDQLCYELSFDPSVPLMATPPPNLSDFTVTVHGAQFTVTAVTIDAVNGKMLLTTNYSTNNNEGPVSIVYTPTSDALQDAAGNATKGFTISGSPPNQTTTGITASTYDPPAPQVPSALDVGAWNVLNSINPSVAAQWHTAFANAGLISSAPAPAPAPAAPSLFAAAASTSSSGSSTSSTGDLMGTLFAVYSARASDVQDQLQQQIATIQQENNSMGLLNTALGAMNKMDAALAAGTDATKTLSSTLGDQYSSLCSEVNSALVAAGLKPFSDTSGLVEDGTTKGDLDGAIQQLKSQIDAAGNNQQTDMLRLQSLTTTYNQCYEIMSNALQQMSSDNDKIIQNLA